MYLSELRLQQETGKVSRAVIVNTILAAWQLRRMRLLSSFYDDVRNVLEVQVPEIARRYGLTRLWRATYSDMLRRRLEEQLDDDTSLEKRYHCGRCGREIWNELSVGRGLGPVCVHKVGTPVQRS